MPAETSEITPEWTRDAASAAAAYEELRQRLGQRLVDEERTSDHGHAHQDVYRLAMEQSTLHRLLLHALRGEPERGMALGLVFEFIGGDDPPLAQIALGVLAPGSREPLMADQRTRDVVLVRAATDLRVLDLLASSGSSRHVRAQATERARRIRRERDARH